MRFAQRPNVGVARGERDSDHPSTILKAAYGRTPRTQIPLGSFVERCVRVASSQDHAYKYQKASRVPREGVPVDMGSGSSRDAFMLSVEIPVEYGECEMSVDFVTEIKQN